MTHTKEPPEFPGRFSAALYLNANTPSGELYLAAEYRLRSVIDLLSALHLLDQDDEPARTLGQISRSLLLLVADAQALYQAEHERNYRQR